jgi:peptidoglycan/LPS O-acetylase OafA/YrhL
MMLDRFFLLGSRSIPWLDGMRAVAILLVVIRHVFDRPYHQLVGENIFSTDALWLKLLAGFGWSGVTLFFIISGFLVGGTIVLEVHSGTFCWREFALKRFMRVYVPAALFLTLMAIVNQWDIPSTVGLHNYLLMANYTRDIWLSHYWSLAVEEHFYILLPIAGIFLTQILRRHSLVSLSRGILVIALSFSLLRLVAAQTDLAISPDDYYRLSHWQLDYFAVGIALRLFYEHQKTADASWKIAPSLTENTFIICAFFSIIIALSWFTSNVEGNSVLNQNVNGGTSGMLYLLNVIMFGTMFFFLIIGGMIKALAARWLRIVAAISFSTYIVHVFVLENTPFLYQPLSGLNNPTIELLAALSIGLGTSLAAGLLFFVLVERPVLLLRDRLLQ